MKTTIRLLAVFLFANLLAPARAAEVDPYLPNDSDLVLSWNVEQFLQSPLAIRYVHTTVTELLKSTELIQTVLKDLDLDPLKDIYRVTLAGTLDTHGKKLVIIKGKFNREKAQALALKAAADPNSKDNIKIRTEGGFTIYELAGENKPAYLGFAADSILLASQQLDVLKDALARTSGKTGQPKKEMAGLIARASDKDTLWLAALPSGDAMKAVPTDNAQQKQALEKVQAISGSMRVDTDVKLEWLLQCGDAASATGVNKNLQDFIGLMKLFVPNIAKEKPEYAPLIEVVATLHSGAKDKAVRLTGEITPSVIDKALKVLRGE